MANGLTITTNKSIPIILKRKDAKGSYEKLECSEFNENIDENKKRKVVETKELVQRSSSRKVGALAGRAVHSTSSVLSKRLIRFLLLKKTEN